jgi:hypothetical protein
LRTCGLAGAFRAGQSVTASSIITELFGGGKVGCHMGVWKSAEPPVEKRVAPVYPALPVPALPPGNLRLEWQGYGDSGMVALPVNHARENSQYRSREKPREGHTVSRQPHSLPQAGAAPHSSQKQRR